MNGSPLISVVMSVYNSEETLPETLDSILSQQGVELEFIVVNDGSKDDSLSILNEYSKKDHRLKILDQENQGLTRSLIRGCAAARGEFIARQDAGDISLPGRLEKEMLCLSNNSDVVLVSCGTRFVGPKGEHLYDILQSDEGASLRLKTLNVLEIKGPSHHGSTMFRKKDYEAVGGYRHYFQVAQDLDLWIRLVEHAQHRTVSEVLYQASLTKDSISSMGRDWQIATTKLILECARRRRRGQSEQAILEQAAQLEAGFRKTPGWLQQANFYYFIASCSNDNKKNARFYYKQALMYNPLHLKAIFRLIQTVF